MSSVFPPGVQLAARYRVLRLLESNPVGGLFEAERLDTQRRVALKWLRFAGGPAQLAQQRAAQARAASLVRHPQLAVVHDVAHEGSSLFVVSEMLQGEPLRAFLAPHAMALHERLRALADAGRALAFAHQKGVVHGGLHPGNIFLHREHEAWVGLPPVVKVHDFGTATSTVPECLAYPAQRSPLGAHAFLDHAQLCGSEPDAQSDIYAFAVLLFQALTGSVPFVAKSPIELAVTLATSPVPRLGDQHAGLPAPLDALIHQSLQHARNERPKQLAPLAAQVSAYAEALAARELLTADDSKHTRRLVRERAAPGAQATRLLTLIGDNATAQACVPRLFARAPEDALRPVAEGPRFATAPSAASQALLPAAPPAPAQLAATSLNTPLAPHPEEQARRRADPAATQREAVSAPPAGASAGGQQALFVPCDSPRVAREMPKSESVVEISRHPTVVGEAPSFASRADAQRAGYVEVVGRTRFRPQLKLAVEPAAPVLTQLARSLQSTRVRAWSAAAAAILVLAGISASSALPGEPEEPALSAPPALPSVYRAPPVPHRRHRLEQPAQRDPMLGDARGTSAHEQVADARGASAREQVVGAPGESAHEGGVDALGSSAREQANDALGSSALRSRAEAPRASTRGPSMDVSPEQPAHFERRAADPFDTAMAPARVHRRERVPAALVRAKTARSDARPIKLEQASHDDGYLVGPLPTKDQF